jgi:hypothetical protein
MTVKHPGRPVSAATPYKAVMLNLSPVAIAYMRAAATATGRSSSGWLRRVLERMAQGASASAAPPEGAEWIECIVTERDIGRTAWMRDSDALPATRQAAMPTTLATRPTTRPT